MCPACASTLVLVLAGAGTTGGLTALVVRVLRGKNDMQDPADEARDGASEQKESR